MSWKILLPVDGSEGSAHAARHVANLAGLMPALEVHLVSVQPPGNDWMVRRMLKAEEIASMEREWAEDAIGPAREILRTAGVACTEHVVQGEVAQTIARLATELGCDQIVMGTRGQSALSGLLLGSVTIKVLHLAEIPVTLVK
ncbi:MAG: universal stress protein [Thiobacillaceae bacterium]